MRIFVKEPKKYIKSLIRDTVNVVNEQMMLNILKYEIRKFV